MRRRRRFADQSGAEVIEFALVLPLLLLIVMGIIDFGLIFRTYEVITNAAREGARIGVLPGYGNADIIARVDQYVQAAGLGGPGTATTTPGALQQVAIGGSCISVKPVTVSMTHTYLFLGDIASYFGGSFGTKTLTATSAMRAEAPAAACP